MLSRRWFLSGAAALLATPTAATTTVSGLTSLSGDARPIGPGERKARMSKLQSLMQAQGVAAFLVESGSSLDYLTGVQWWRSERVTAALIPATGAAIVVTPAFEEPSVRESLQVEAEVRTWDEPENPQALMVTALADRKITRGKIAVEPTTRVFILDALRAAGKHFEPISGAGLINACRQIKSPAELALMQVASDITMAAYRYVHGKVRAGMSGSDIGAIMAAATTALGGEPEFSMALLNEASAYPHGSHQAQTVREGSVILMDCGCTVHGYQSDISRTWVFGEPTAKQRKVWDTVKRGQDIALETAVMGLSVGRIDDAVRTYYEHEGWGPGYRLPGLSHRTGHGIGMDGHESPYLVHSDLTPLQAGMCFSDEPGLYIPGEFGVRLEDCWYMTQAGPKLFSPLARSIDEPV